MVRTVMTIFKGNLLIYSTIIIPITYACGIIFFAMLGAGSLGGMIVFAILYGFFSGGCKKMTYIGINETQN
jgi:hypothetical protein